MTITSYSDNINNLIGLIIKKKQHRLYRRWCLFVVNCSDDTAERLLLVGMALLLLTWTFSIVYYWMIQNIK